LKGREAEVTDLSYRVKVVAGGVDPGWFGKEML
jgi:hypothetical protein